MTDTIDIAMEWMKNSYKMWQEASLSLLKFPFAIVEFIDSCNFTSDQLKSIIRDIEELKWSDFDEWESIQDQFDRSEAQNGQY